MKKGALLYYLTAGWALLTLAIGLYYLFVSTTPTADVSSRLKPLQYTVTIKGWGPGEFRTLTIAGRPVVIWRRSQMEMAAALSQIDSSLGPEGWLEILKDGSLVHEIGPERFARIEWLVISPINTAGFGCIVLTKAGDYDGFFDPCRGAHFDMWGRIKKGPNNNSLVAQAPKFTEDGQSLVLDLSRLPPTK